MSHDIMILSGFTCSKYLSICIYIPVDISIAHKWCLFTYFFDSVGV
jgi:hypothetical protein